MKKISVLIPTYNEELNVVPITEAVLEQLNRLENYDYELVFIDNNSTDSTRDLLRKICSENNKVKAIFNAKNYGQFNSPYYGIMQCTGDCVIEMVADFQDPVELIPRYIEEWEKGYKIVLAKKTASKESRIVYHLRGMFYNFMKKHSSIDYMEQVTGSGLYDREFIEVMKTIDDTRPVLRAIVAEVGYNVKVIEYEQPKRKRGKSSNNIASYYDAAIQNITAYTKIGIRFTLIAALVLLFIDAVAATSIVIYKLFNWDTFQAYPLLMYLLIIMGILFNMVFTGFIGEYIIDINIRMRKRPLVVESERINF